MRAFFQLSEWDERPSVGRPPASRKEPNSHLAGMVSMGMGTEMVARATSNGGGAADDADATDFLACRARQLLVAVWIVRGIHFLAVLSLVYMYFTILLKYDLLF